MAKNCKISETKTILNLQLWERERERALQNLKLKLQTQTLEKLSSQKTNSP